MGINGNIGELTRGARFLDYGVQTFGFHPTLKGALSFLNGSRLGWQASRPSFGPHTPAYPSSYISQLNYLGGGLSDDGSAHLKLAFAVVNGGISYRPALSMDPFMPWFDPISSITLLLIVSQQLTIWNLGRYVIKVSFEKYLSLHPTVKPIRIAESSDYLDNRVS